MRSSGKSSECEIAARYRLRVSFRYENERLAKSIPAPHAHGLFIATEVLIFDQVKFNAKAELLNQAARALRGSQLTVPSERPSNPPGDAGMEKL